jgi:hypothetical protein
MRAKTKLILSSVVLFLLFSILIFLSISALKKIEDVSKKILEKKKEDLSLNQRIKNVKEFEEIQKEREKEFSEIESILFNKDLPLPFVTFLEKIAKQKQVSIEISTQEILSKEKNIFPFLYFRVKFFGAPTSVFVFLEKIEKSQFLIQIERLRISKVKETENLEGEVLIKTSVKE